MERSQLPSPKSKPGRVAGPEMVLQRLLTPRPFPCRAPVGNADTVISPARNTEKMFAYYPDYSDRIDVSDSAHAVKSPLHSSRLPASIEDASNITEFKSPQPRWLPSPQNRLWGNIVHVPVRRQKSPDFSYCSKEGRRSSFLASEIIEKNGDVHEPQALTNERGQNTASLAEADTSNLSPTMRRAMKVLKKHSSNTLNQQNLDETLIRVDLITIPRAEDLPTKEAQDDSRIRPHPHDLFDTQIGSDTISSILSIDSPTLHPRLALSEELRSGVLESLSNYRGHPMVPTNLDGEFVVMKDTLDPSGGVKVGFGGLSLLQEHISKSWVNRSTVLALEFEFCTHGYDAVSAGDILKSKYYRHYMTVCDAIESKIASSWSICFLIKRGKPRRGAFEIQLLWLVGSVEYSLTVASKLCSSKFPDPELLAKRLANALEGLSEPSSVGQHADIL